MRVIRDRGGEEALRGECCEKALESGAEDCDECGGWDLKLATKERNKWAWCLSCHRAQREEKQEDCVFCGAGVLNLFRWGDWPNQLSVAVLPEHGAYYPLYEEGEG